MTVRRFRITVNGQVFEVEAEEMGASPAAGTSAAPPESRPAAPPPPEKTASTPAGEVHSVLAPGSTVVVRSPLPGVVLEVKVAEGASVQEGQILVLLEAMKMENEIAAPVTGVIQEIQVEKGDAVGAGDPLIVLGS